MPTKKRKLFAFSTFVMLIMVTFLSLSFIIKAADHDCAGEDCPVCVCIHRAEQMLKNLGAGTVKADAWVLAQALSVLAVSCVFLLVPCTSLTSQKVRLNN